MPTTSHHHLDESLLPKRIIKLREELESKLLLVLSAENENYFTRDFKKKFVDTISSIKRGGIISVDVINDLAMKGVIKGNYCIGLAFRLPIIIDAQLIAKKKNIVDSLKLNFIVKDGGNSGICTQRILMIERWKLFISNILIELEEENCKLSCKSSSKSSSLEDHRVGIGLNYKFPTLKNSKSTDFVLVGKSEKDFPLLFVQSESLKSLKRQCSSFKKIQISLANSLLFQLKCRDGKWKVKELNGLVAYGILLKNETEFELCKAKLEVEETTKKFFILFTTKKGEKKFDLMRGKLKLLTTEMEKENVNVNVNVNDNENDNELEKEKENQQLQLQLQPHQQLATKKYKSATHSTSTVAVIEILCLINEIIRQQEYIKSTDLQYDNLDK